jgi:hypothetical protein
MSCRYTAQGEYVCDMKQQEPVKATEHFKDWVMKSKTDAYNQADAKRICNYVCKTHGGWTGSWNTDDKWGCRCGCKN